MDTIYFVMQQTFFFMMPLLIVALGGMFSERAGIVNIALEGKMLMGAFTSIFFINRIQNSSIAIDGQALLLLALVVAAAVGVVVAFFHAYASISLNANQVISGVAITCLPRRLRSMSRGSSERHNRSFSPTHSTSARCHSLEASR